MTLPDATLSFTDGALGLSAPNGRETACIGACTAGELDTVYSFTQPSSVESTLGYGPLAEAVAHKLAVGGGTVHAIRVDPDTDGAAGSVTADGTGTSVMTVSGVVADAFTVLVTVTRAASGVSATVPAQFTYTLDDGATPSAPVNLPSGGVYTVPRTGGLVLTFGTGTLVVGDTYAFTCTAPSYSASTLTAAMAVLATTPRVYKHVFAVNTPASVSASKTFADAMQTALVLQATGFRYAHGVTECFVDTDSATIAGFATCVADRVSVGAGRVTYTSAITGRQFKGTAALAFAARRHSAPIHEDSIRVESGALPLVASIARDESLTPGLDAARFVTLRTYTGRRGTYITNGNTFANVGSDFALVQHREVMDVTATLHRRETVSLIGRDWRVNPAPPGYVAPAPEVELAAGDPGTIDERDARAIETRIGRVLSEALVAAGHASAVSVAVTRTDNLLSTARIRLKVRVLPFGYSHFIDSELGFTNPALGA